MRATSQYYYSGQPTGTSLFTKRDVSIASLRLDDTSTAEKIALRLNTRFPWRTTWRINPRLEINSRDETAGGDE